MLSPNLVAIPNSFGPFSQINHIIFAMMMNVLNLFLSIFQIMATKWIMFEKKLKQIQYKTFKMNCVSKKLKHWVFHLLNLIWILCHNVYTWLFLSPYPEKLSYIVLSGSLLTSWNPRPPIIKISMSENPSFFHKLLLQQYFSISVVTKIHFYRYNLLAA